VRLADIDLDANKELQAQLKIQGFPTLMLFKNGVAINFGGSRTKEFMTSWLGKKIQDPIIRIEQARLASLETDGNVNIVLHGAADTPQYNAVLAIAKADDYNSKILLMQCTIVWRAPPSRRGQWRSSAPSEHQF
jgi:thioredoxin-like negative regulator of GroEL